MVLCVAEQSQSQCKYYVHVITIINVYSEYRIAILWHTHSSKFTELKDVRHARNHHSQIHVLHVVGMCQKLRMHQTEIQEWKKKNTPKDITISCKRTNVIRPFRNRTSDGHSRSPACVCALRTHQSTYRFTHWICHTFPRCLCVVAVVVEYILVLLKYIFNTP